VYKVVYLDSVAKDFKSLGKPAQKRTLDKIEKVLAKDPKVLGKSLKGQFKGFWRYRIGDIRVIYKISESEILIIVAKVAHRKKVYGNTNFIK